MNQIHRHDAGLAFGAFLGSFHLVWALMVLVGIAQPFMDFIFNVHMITPPYIIDTFSWSKSIGLIVVTSLIGYVMGWFFALVWNKLHKV